MKRCKKCLKFYSDDMQYCLKCGSRLQSIKTLNHVKKLNTLLGLALAFVVVFFCFMEFQSSRERKKNNELIEKYRPTVNDLEVVNWDEYSDYYTDYHTISGKVRNISDSKTISYYEVTVKFYDYNGDIVGSDYTNDNQEIGPGESREFEIMFENSSNYKEAEVFVSEVE
ncbi:MAG: FxLYD domain-containing protein [Lachnospiraceae bacterium]|nr:FxLYD domain-containing protein [Lachnospiraceae bacterium]